MSPVSLALAGRYLPVRHLGNPTSEVNDTLIHLIMVVISQCIHISNILYNYLLHLKDTKIFICQLYLSRAGKKLYFWITSGNVRIPGPMHKNFAHFKPAAQ